MSSRPPWLLNELLSQKNRMGSGWGRGAELEGSTVPLSVRQQPTRCPRRGLLKWIQPVCPEGLEENGGKCSPDLRVRKNVSNPTPKMNLNKDDAFGYTETFSKTTFYIKDVKKRKQES